MTLKVASFFSGIGGFDLGFENVGMKIVFQCEKDKFCQKVLKKHWPDVLLMDDITKIKYNDIPKADLWCAGFPCQDVSSANQGKRKGINGDRSGLFYALAKLLDETKEKPKWIVLENVPGLLNCKKGKDFQRIIATMDELRYGISWRVLDAKYFGVPQRRKRLFIVGSYRSCSSTEVFFGEGTPTIDPDQVRSERKKIASRNGKSYHEPNLYTIQHASIGRKPEAGPQAKGYRNDGETWTLDARGSADVVCSTADPFRVRETTRISSELDGNRYRRIGNAVAVPVIEWLGKRILLAENSQLIPPQDLFSYCPIEAIQLELPLGIS
ncbi:MAG: DNA cytosine methyltransferase [Phormidium sp.]